MNIGKKVLVSFTGVHKYMYINIVILLMKLPPLSYTIQTTTTMITLKSIIMMMKMKMKIIIIIIMIL